MPTYTYQCTACKMLVEQYRAADDREKRRRCKDCADGMLVHRLDIDMRTVHAKGLVPDWRSQNAGVQPHEAAEATKRFHQEHPGIDVNFCPVTGDAVVHGGDRDKFLKARGMRELDANEVAKQ